MSPPTSTTDDYRDALAMVRALVANDRVAAETIAKHADREAALLTKIAGVAMYLLSANVADPLRLIDAIFDRLAETLAQAAEERQRDSSGKGDEALK